MCNTIALSTVAIFLYVPDTNLLKKNYAKSKGIKLDSMTTVEKWETEATEDEKKGLETEKKKLLELESKK